MFKLQKNQKPAFSKLYRYYCTKLLKKIGVVIFYLLLSIFIMFIWGISFRKHLDSASGWQGKLAIFWITSFFQLYALWMAMAPLISYLVGRGLGWEELQKRQLFQMPKISREEDVKVLIFTPDVKRETVILAKFSAAFTYFMAINFFLTLLLAIYLLVATKIGIIATFFFLLLNGIGFGLINFLLIVPFLFYSQEAGSFLLYLLFLENDLG